MFARNTRCITRHTSRSASKVPAFAFSKRNASSAAENETEVVVNVSDVNVSTEEPMMSASAAKKYVQLQEQKVSNTWNIPKKDLYLDMLFNSQGPLLEPVKVEVAEKLFNTPISRMYVNKNGQMKLNKDASKQQRKNTQRKHHLHNHHNKSQQQAPTILEDLERYRMIRDSQKNHNHHVFFANKNTSASTNIFTHSAISQLPLENNALLNLPHSLVMSLKPFTCPTQPGNESYRDDKIVVRKLQIEERENAALVAKKGERDD